MADEESKLDLSIGHADTEGEPKTGSRQTMTGQEWIDAIYGTQFSAMEKGSGLIGSTLMRQTPMEGTAARERKRAREATSNLWEMENMSIDEKLRLISEGASANDFKYLTPEQQGQYGELTTSSMADYQMPAGGPVSMDPTRSSELASYPPEDFLGGGYGPMQSYESSAVMQAKEDKARGKQSKEAKEPKEGGPLGNMVSAVKKPVTSADMMQRTLNEMFSSSQGPTSSDVEKTHQSLYGPESAIAKSQQNIDYLHKESEELTKRQAQLELSARAEQYKLMSIDKAELGVKEQISGDFADMSREQYEKFSKAADAVDNYITAQREKWENEDPISAFRMFDWFKKEKNEQGQYEDSFQWSGFATSLASLAGVAGNVFLNMATDGKVPLFAINLLTTAMNNDLSAQKSQIAAEGKRANLFGTMLDAYENEALALNHYREVQYENAATYFKKLRAEVQTSDQAKARGLANLENTFLQEANKLKMARQTNMREHAKEMAAIDVDRLTQSGAAQQRISVQNLQLLNGLSMASAADAKRAEAPDGNWDNANFEVKLIMNKGSLAKRVNEAQRLSESFVKRFGNIGALYQFWGTDIEDALGRFGSDDPRKVALTTLRDNVRDLAQRVAKTRDVGNLSVQEQEWWFTMGPNVEEQPLGVVLAKIATLAHSSRLEAIDAWSIANNENRSKYQEVYMATFNVASPQELSEIVAQNRKSLLEGQVPFTNLDLSKYPQDMQIAMEAALGGSIQAGFTVEPIDQKSGISYRQVVQEGASIPVAITGGISDELKPELRSGEKIKGAPKEGYAYLPTDKRDADGNIIKSRHTQETATAIARMSTHISRMTNGKINIRTSGSKTGIRTRDEMDNLKKQHENWKAEQKGLDKPHPGVRSNRFAPDKHGGHAQAGARKKGMYEAIDFTVKDSRDSAEYRALITLGPYFGIYPAHKTDVDHPHWHHFEFRPDQIKDNLKGSPALPGYGGIKARPGTATTTVHPGSVARLRGGMESPEYDAWNKSPKELEPYQMDQEAIRNLLQHQQAFAKGRGLGPLANLRRNTKGRPMRPSPQPAQRRLGGQAPLGRRGSAMRPMGIPAPGPRRIGPLGD